MSGLWWQTKILIVEPEFSKESAFFLGLALLCLGMHLGI